MKMVASANVSHTTVYMPGEKLGFHALPVSMGWYSEGLVLGRGGRRRIKRRKGRGWCGSESMTPEQLMAVARLRYVARMRTKFI